MEQHVERDFSHKRVLFFGITIIFVIFGLFGVWAAFSEVETSVQAPGKVIVQSYKKVIKHPKGGIVQEVEVEEGEEVTKGQELLRLDTTQLEAQLQGVRKEYLALLARKERIEAELDGKEEIEFSSQVPLFKRQEERSIMRSRRQELMGKLRSLKLQIEELEKENEHLYRSLKTKRSILSTYKQELRKWRELLKEQLADESQVFDLERKVSATEAEIQNIEATIDKNRMRMKELQNSIALTKSSYERELREALKDVATKLPSLKSRIEVLEDEIKKSRITAPSEGIVVDMQVHTPGEVIAPHQPILSIVPKNDRLVIEAMISPMDIDKVRVGEKAEINFASYVDPSAKPVEAEVIYVSADTISDPKDPKLQYYKALLRITEKGMRAIKENGFEVLPGMPVTVFIKAGKRTFLSYILTPIEQLLRGAFHAN